MNDHLQICPFPENKPAMLSFTFDDGTLDHLETAAPELEKRGWRGTFYINPQSNNRPPEKLLDWNGIRELYRRGHEIGNHTMSHCHPSKWETTKRYDLLAWEIAESQRQFSEHLGMRPKSYTAPFGARCEFISSLLAANNLLETRIGKLPPQSAEHNSDGNRGKCLPAPSETGSLFSVWSGLSAENESGYADFR